MMGKKVMSVELSFEDGTKYKVKQGGVFFSDNGEDLDCGFINLDTQTAHLMLQGLTDATRAALLMGKSVRRGEDDAFSMQVDVNPLNGKPNYTFIKED